MCSVGVPCAEVSQLLAGWELWYEPSKPNDWGREDFLQVPRNMNQLEVYIDTSFGLEHEQSRSVHGMLHEWAGAPLQWHSGRQPWIAASTGEAELIGTVKLTNRLFPLVRDREPHPRAEVRHVRRLQSRFGFSNGREWAMEDEASSDACPSPSRSPETFYFKPPCGAKVVGSQYGWKKAGL